MTVSAITSEIQLEHCSSAVNSACKRVAPAWPLDRSIAVNPWWPVRHKPAAEVAAELEALGKVHCLMPRSYYRSLWGECIQPRHLANAAQQLNVASTEPELIASLAQHEPEHHWHNVSDLVDALPGREHRMAWREEIIQQISQFAGLYFQHPEQMQQPAATGDFYRAWLDVVQHDRGIEVLMGEKGLLEQFRRLPSEPQLVIAEMYQMLGCPQRFSEYAYALLLDTHGWASWLAYLAWQEALEGRESDLVQQLLAVRLAWDWVLWRHMIQHQPDSFAKVKAQFVRQFARFDLLYHQYLQSQQALWVWQRALELSFEEALQQKLLAAPQQPTAKPSLQAVFCIDVRSEPMRRALEAQSDRIQTLGFAGFFGLPLEYAPTGGDFSRPQLPGLLKSSIKAEPATMADKKSKRVQSVALVNRWRSVGKSPAATFGVVEALGLGKALSLFRNSWSALTASGSADALDSSAPWRITRQGYELPHTEQAQLAGAVLQAMGLTNDFATTVLLLGHGSCTTNNPQAAALDCGACGGQTGEVNAKVLAQILNDPAVREELSNSGIEIPMQTRFVAGLHNTTTDDITCFETLDEHLHTWISDASAAARKQRAASMGIPEVPPERAAESFARLASDWSEVRPEWGLANNAAFIVAPRDRTRHLNLEGRCFLHDYRWQNDQDFAVLEQIMTAPMVVTNWINMQYYASVTDNTKFGSGNKLLHNVVGGHIGVFEGNGGDLRNGLALQSVHDGRNWRHQPLRLGVYIDAPQQAISAVVQKHEAVADLVDNGWLFLFQLDNTGQRVWRYEQGSWRVAAAADTPRKSSG